MKKSILILTVVASAIALISFVFIPEPRPSRPILDPNRGIQRCFGGANFQFIAPRDSGSPIAPKLVGLGDLHFEVSTEAEAAQYFFDQGMKLVYAFNHAEAHRSFKEAARLDPDLAMAYWGQALALGPNINDPLPNAERQMEAWKAVEQATRLADRSSSLERDLISAMRSRCTSQAEWDQTTLNEAYFEAMRTVYQRHGEHPDVGVLYGAAIMNTMPWNYYDASGEARPNTQACVAALGKVYREHPNHPGAHHYFIHIIEATDPHAAIPNADALGQLMPGAGHIVHMPSHIYLAVGMYEKAAIQNRLAVQTDQDYIAQCQAQGVYPLAYYPHNIHFLWAAASMLGRSQEAIAAALKVADKVPNYLGSDIPFIQDFLSVPLQAYVRFGKWNEILTTPEPPSQLLHTRMMWHYARGMAWVRKGQTDRARMELEKVTELGRSEAAASLLAAYNNPTSEVAKVAIPALAGAIAAGEGKVEEAVRLLERSVAAEDALVYQEPSAWHAPMRHFLGAVLIEDGQFEKAEKVYRADLLKHPNNGWALFGLAESLQAQGNEEAAAAVRLDFEKAWAQADVELQSSRF